MDIFEKCGKFTDAREAIAGGYYPYFIPLAESEGTAASYHGHQLVMCGSNNYLGLTTHPKVREAAIEAIRQYGTSCSGSRFLNGTLEMHEQLENELAAWVGKKAALIFSTGMQVNLGTISSIANKDDIIILDKDDHASIVDGTRLSGAKIERFRHNDLTHLERVLQSIREPAGKLLIVDGVFSMGGDLAPLDKLAEMSCQYNFRLMVDDAHGMGVTGGGRGTAAQFGVTDKTDLIMSTFSKSFASLGGFIAGDEDVIHYIKHFARALIFSASPTPASTASALAALHIMRDEPERVERVNAIGRKMKSAYQALGFKTGDSATPIVPIIIGDDKLTFTAWKLLFDEGVFVNPVISPAVPPGMQLLRTSYMATHTDQQLDFVLDKFEKVGKQIGLIG